MLPVAVSVVVPRPRAAVQPRLHNALLVELLFDLLTAWLHHFCLLGFGEMLAADESLIWVFPVPVPRGTGCEMGTADRWWCTEEGHDLFGEASCP